MCANINKQKFGLTVLAAFVFTVAFNWLFHGQLLMDQYKATEALWRPMAEIESMMIICLIKQFLIALLLVWLFVGGYENKGLKEGVRYGLAVGLLMGLLNAGAYIYLPIPQDLALGWLAGGILHGLGIGIIASLLYKGPAVSATA